LKGKFDLQFRPRNDTTLQLKNCYSCINCYRGDSDKINEFNSMNFEFESKLETIEDQFGEGLPSHHNLKYMMREIFFFQKLLIFKIQVSDP
jgi:hypothetical protein